jgi:hypothetical protein
MIAAAVTTVAFSTCNGSSTPSPTPTTPVAQSIEVAVVTDCTEVYDVRDGGGEVAYSLASVSRSGNALDVVVEHGWGCTAPTYYACVEIWEYDEDTIGEVELAVEIGGPGDCDDTEQHALRLDLAEPIDFQGGDEDVLFTLE